MTESVPLGDTVDVGYRSWVEARKAGVEYGDWLAEVLEAVEARAGAAEAKLAAAEAKLIAIHNILVSVDLYRLPGVKAIERIRAIIDGSGT